MLSRKEAEDLLTDEKEGTFLVRIAEHLWSYTISCRTNHGIKHYLIDASNRNYYRLLVNDRINHESLSKSKQTEIFDFEEKRPYISSRI